MKKFTLLFLVAIVATLVTLTPSGCSSPPDTAFQRVDTDVLPQDNEHFRLDRSLQRIYYKNGSEEIHLDKLPSINASFFYLKGKKQIKIEPLPALTGADIRFYSYLYLDSMDANRRIDFSLDIYRNGQTLPVEHMSVINESRDFFADMDLKKGDLLLLRFSGHGIVYFSRPVIYRAVKFSKKKSGGNYIILIGVDTLRGDMVGRQINGKSLTPNIDAFIQDSVYMDRAYSQTSWTLVSFMSMFTGLYEYHHDVGVKNPLAPDKPFLVEQLARNYISVGYHGGKVMNSRWGFSRGFDYYNKYQPAGALYKNGGQSVFRKGLRLIETSRFPNLFLFLHTYQVHAPYWPPEEFVYILNPNPVHTKLDAVNFSEPEKTYLPVDDQLKQSLKELYQAEVLAFDSYFGEFIGKLKKIGIYNNAMIILVSDHGEEFFEHKGWAHSHALYDEQIRVPMIIKFPANRFGHTRISNPVGLLDLMPTVLSYLNIDYDFSALDGKDLMPLIKTPHASEFHRGPVISTISTGRYFEAIPTRIALHFDHYKLIYNAPFTQRNLDFFKNYTAPPQPPKLELFDLSPDPGETRNIAGSLPRIQDKMMPLLLEIRKAIIKKLAAGGKGNQLDKEVQEQLKSLGYL